MYKNYIPELPEKYNEINEKLFNKELRTENDIKEELYAELDMFLDSERLKLIKEFPIPGDKNKETYYGFPLETITLKDLSDIYIYHPEDYTNDTLKAIKIGHLFIIDNTYRKEGVSYFKDNFGTKEIKELLLNNQVVPIDPCLIKYGYDHDYYGCMNIAPFFLEKDVAGDYFICNWS